MWRFIRNFILFSMKDKPSIEAFDREFIKRTSRGNIKLGDGNFLTRGKLNQEKEKWYKYDFTRP